MKAEHFTRTSPLFKTLADWLEMIKFEHTIFALPFALSGLLLASPGLPLWSTCAWTILAFSTARAAAMTINRIVDADIDALNPRTATRAIPAGIINRSNAYVFTVISFGLMLFAAAHLPRLCLLLAPIAVLWLSFYSFTKRFTWLCHMALGIALAGASLGGWVAAGGNLSNAGPWLLAAATACWVAGFDIIYACQDFEFDRKEKLFSAPAVFGIGAALTISRCLHVLCVLSLSGLGFALSMGLPYFVGLVLVAGALVYEHWLVKPDDLSRVNAAFFTMNGVVSIIFFLSILSERLLTYAGRL